MDSEGKPTSPDPEQSREFLEGRVKMIHNFKTAVRSGTFAGAQAEHIAVLLNVLEQDYQSAVKAYEAAAATHPEWGQKQPAGRA
jgi:hypothetical protein